MNNFAILLFAPLGLWIILITNKVVEINSHTEILAKVVKTQQYQLDILTESIK